MKLLLAALFLSFNAVHAESLSVQELKSRYEKKAFEIKITEELNSAPSDLDSLMSPSTNMDCVEFVYMGAATREESIRACSGVSNIECVKFVYQGSATREASARACAGVVDMQCVRFAYNGPMNREESARSCGYGGPRPPHCL